MKKLKRADKNMKEFFADLKRDVLDKNDDENILPGIQVKVRELKGEMRNRQFIRCLYYNSLGVD